MLSCDPSASPTRRGRVASARLHLDYTKSITQGPTVTADTVVGRDGFLVGAETSYNVTDGTIAKWSAALGYTDTNYAVTLHGLNKFNTFHASYYHRVSKDVEAGAKAVYDTKATQGGVALEVGTKTWVHLTLISYCAR